MAMTVCYVTSIDDGGWRARLTSIIGTWYRSEALRGTGSTINLRAQGLTICLTPSTLGINQLTAHYQNSNRTGRND
jgi:hypothetical protein